MAKFKLLIGDKGKTYTKEVSDEQAASLIGLKVGAVFNGDLIGLGGYEFQITGGSDSGGFPMRKGLHGSISRRVIMSPGIGFRSTVRGIKKKKRVMGDTISENLAQINTKMVKEGPTPLDKALAAEVKEEGAEGEGAEAKASDAKAPEAPAAKGAAPEAPKEEKAEDKKEDKKEEKKKEKPPGPKEEKEKPEEKKPEEQKPEEAKPKEPKGEPEEKA